ncbi:M1 family metallopeptidase [Mucilaginibacter myungsuensis]|uniref:Aminopeptidase N n=1 Tax=Mucilaginibacter myungsuensis TaxID=649104 RepID=A0A929PVA3_9SPHI|nr:M1 family aminopeptidase [Mucilaginibacter myungsuensis]MBE9660801.1 aminopeptidase [Mucilaginibacter myungsuensis]MDN3600847.1 M1 family aminopeptidase [Mucilaginibacter myungsuensis]
MKIFNTCVFLLLTAATVVGQQKRIPVVPGVSLELAKYRHANISDIQYTLDLVVPASKEAKITGIENIAFKLNDVDQPLQLDFKQGAGNVEVITANRYKVPVVLKNEHLVIDTRFLQKGDNEIVIRFTPGNASLNRNAEYLYALFVPDRARTVFPCFDQPDLKAKFLLSVQVPKGWKALANGTLKESVGDDLYVFNKSDKLPTYLFSFTAGKYTSVAKDVAGKQAEFLYRETDAEKIRLSVDSIFRAHNDAVKFLEDWTGIPFPFQKIGFVSIPDFQFGGMEHPGVVHYKASSLFLDAGATKDQLIARANLISHETAHMWFGDLVTMKWFNDVWMKEVFANFMADKVTEKVMGAETFKLKFLIDHYPAAYGVDRTAGANPIRQQLDNLQDAGSMYGNIIYHKAPIMMRQLELLMGKDNFQTGVREYLKKYSYSNATWNDLITILGKHTTKDLNTWNKVWVNQPGRPVFDYKMAYSNGKITDLTITQRAERGLPRLWPQKFAVTLIYADHNENISADIKTASLKLTAAVGKAVPVSILFNSDEMGYGLFPADTKDLKTVLKLSDPLQRASAYINMYENMLAGRYFKPTELLALFSVGLRTEQNELNLRLIAGYLSNIYWQFIPTAQRKETVAGLEQMVWDAMSVQTTANTKKILFNTYQNIYGTPEAGKRIYTIWKDQKAPEGIKLFEDDYTGIALTIALKSDSVTSVIKQQQARISNPERKARLDFLMPALSNDPAERDKFFISLKERKNREKEAWVSTGLSYTNHPLRQASARKHLTESLAMVEEIQRTGDIFFPQSWLAAIFGNYQNVTNYKVVTEFLKAHPQYNPKLKDKILQTTDNLYRASKLTGK